MIDIVLPTKHSVANPATNQINSAVFAIRRMRGPNRIAASPIIENRTVRAPKTIASSRIFGNWNALAAAMTAVKGNGGGARPAMTSARAARCFNRLTSV